MQRHGLLLARHTGRRRPRQHDGQVATLRSNVRWCSDGLEFTCWNGEIVRVAFALDCHDREVIAWVATTAGICGEMIRDMMVECVEKRFGAFRAPYRVQWLSDNGSIFVAHKTVEIALALNLEPCFTPVESPESKRHGRSLCQNLQTRLCPREPDPARACGACSDRSLDGGLQHRASAFAAGLPLTAGVHHRLFATRRVSGLTGSTPIDDQYLFLCPAPWGQDDAHQ